MFNMCKVPWVRGETFREITLKYVNFVLTKFGKSIIVFDGYHFSSTKDITHRRRTKGKTGVLVTFTLDMQLSISKDVFLLNKTNKQIFIEFLGSALTSFGCFVHHADADADVLIVQKAVESAESQ